jgi:hypothetical protein
MIRYIFSIVMVVLANAPLIAQDTVPAIEIPHFSLVRITAPAFSTQQLVGRVRSVDSSRLILSSGDSAFIIPREDVTSLERRFAQPRGGSIVRGAALGAIGGFVVVKLWVDANYENDEYNTLGSLIYGAAPGLIIGGIAGAVLAPRTWIEFKVREWLDD